MSRPTSVIDAVNKVINDRYRFHADKLAARGDLKKLESNLIKWVVGSVIASVGVLTAMMALLLKALAGNDF
ncbi:MAG: hypothetical protein RL018_1356 [Pseudomonadota bacterium]|jgi:hypothetical protein